MKKDPVTTKAVAENPDPGLRPGSMTFSPEEQEMAAALLAVGGVADRAMVCRAQRLVREQAVEIAERRRRVRHGIGITILGFSLLFLVLTPVFWRFWPAAVYAPGGVQHIFYMMFLG